MIDQTYKFKPMKLLTTVHSKNENYSANIILDEDYMLNGKPSLFWFGDCDEDKDGSPDWNHDPYGQAETSLRYDGKPINGNIIPFIVVPPEVAKLVPDKFFGCVGVMGWQKTGKEVAVVVADGGPHNKIGEASSAALAAVGAPTTRNGNGGIDLQEVFYRIWPGVPAVLTVGGVDYHFQLQSWGSSY